MIDSLCFCNLFDSAKAASHPSLSHLKAVEGVRKNVTSDDI